MANLDYKSKKNKAKHVFPSFPFIYLFLFLFLKGVTKTTYREMHECYAMQILELKKKKKIKRRMVTKNIEMKYKDHVRKTQLD